MAVQWLGNVKQTGRGNLAKDIGDAVQPAVNVYADYLAKTSEREKIQVDEFITRAKDLPVNEREAMMKELQSKPEFQKQIQKYAPGVLGEGTTLNLPVNWEVVDQIGTQVIMKSGDVFKKVDLPEGIDYDKYETVTMPNGDVEVRNIRTQEVKETRHSKGIVSTSKLPFTLDNGKAMVNVVTVFADGEITEHIISAGIDKDLEMQQRGIVANKEVAKLNREFKDKWNTKDLQHKVDILEFSASEALRDQGNIESKAKTEQEKFDAKLKENARQFDVSTSLALYRESQTNERFDAELSHQIDMDLKRLNIDVKYKDAIMQDMKDKMSLAHDKYDLSKTTVAMDFVNTSIQLKQQGERLKIAQEESEWSIKAIEAKMNQYQSIGPVFDEDQETIIGASGLRWDEEEGKYVTERLKNIPVSVANLMLQQQAWELEGNEQDNIIKAQGYSGLAAGVYSTLRNGDITSMDTPEAWSSTTYVYAEKYAEGKEDVTAESAYGRILAHAYNRKWIDKEQIPNESLLYTDEANTAFNKEQETWAKENPKTTKVEDTTPSTNPNLMSGGLQTMSPEDNQFKSLLNSFLGNDTLYNTLKSAVTIPEHASNMTLGQALSDMNFSGPISRLEELAPGVLGGTGRRLDEYTKGVERRPTGNSPTGLSPTWKDVLEAFGLGGGKGQ